jgi:hypothetical protein
MHNIKPDEMCGEHDIGNRDCNPGIPNPGIPDCFSIPKSRDCRDLIPGLKNSSINIHSWINLTWN